jgi:hypothetical protein
MTNGQPAQAVSISLPVSSLAKRREDAGYAELSTVAPPQPSCKWFSSGLHLRPPYFRVSAPHL